MLERLKRIALTAIGAIGLLWKAVGGKRHAPSSPDTLKVLRLLATHTSAPVPELASRLKLSTHETVRLLTDLEEGGAVKLSPDHGIEHVRIAAITQAGRDQIAQAA
jgi:DNA-binding IclR family transcriptional regulator